MRWGGESIARNGSVAIETAVSTVIIIFAAEFLPKSIFRNNPNFYYRALAPVIYFFYLLLLSDRPSHDAHLAWHPAPGGAPCRGRAVSPQLRPRRPRGTARYQYVGTAP